MSKNKDSETPVIVFVIILFMLFRSSKPPFQEIEYTYTILGWAMNIGSMILIIFAGFRAVDYMAPSGMGSKMHDEQTKHLNVIIIFMALIVSINVAPKIYDYVTKSSAGTELVRIPKNKN